MGVLMRSQGADFSDGPNAMMLWIADHWTTDDMAAFDTIGMEAFMAWVDRGYAGH